MIILGFIIQLIGFVFCLTIIGAVIGVPLIGIGGIMVLVGFFGRRKTIITNVVQVQNSPAPLPATPPPPASNDRIVPAIKSGEPPAELPNPQSSQAEEVTGS